MVKSAFRSLQFAAAAAALALAVPAEAATEIMWWHAMSGELGRQLEKLALAKLRHPSVTQEMLDWAS